MHAPIQQCYADKGAVPNAWLMVSDWRRVSGVASDSELYTLTLDHVIEYQKVPSSTLTRSGRDDVDVTVLKKTDVIYTYVLRTTYLLYRPQRHSRLTAYHSWLLR